ncbi:NagC family transcriptional regulator [Candidatus Pacearchaeota archaeon]|nr:NagC family transcriptional regulator [Candidatus Pacearchaeota archaeon]
MFGNINPKQIQGVMKKMGISQTPLDAKRVTIELEDSNLVIDEPSVTKVVMQGQETFQIAGEAREESKESFSDEDVKMVMEKTGRGEDEVRKVLEENGGDMAGAILGLK